MSTHTVAEVIVDQLVNAGVKRIYGIVGDSLNPVSDALRRDGTIDWVHVRHEEVGAFAAGAEAQLSGELAVCAGSSGPGNLHLINGLFDAHRSHAPVLALASHILGSEIGTQYFQETHPDRQVIAMCGDGGFSMLMGDLLTIASYDLPIKIIVYNNGTLGFVSLEMRASGLPNWQTEMKNPNFAKLAEAVGVRGIRIEQANEVESSLKSALQHKGPVLIDAVTDPNVVSLPPNITLNEMEGFSLGMSKMVLSGHIDAVLGTIKSNWRSL